MHLAIQSPVNVICMKWGDKYGPEYVNRLYRQVSRWLRLPHRFVCLTDKVDGLLDGIETLPIPDLGIEGRLGNTTWRKLGVFSNRLGNLEGPALFLDLDIVVCSDLTRFFAYQPDHICIIHNWISPHKTLLRPRPEIGNSSVFRFPANECSYIVEHFQAEKEQALQQWWPPQTYLTERIRDRMAYWPDSWVRSFKFHCRRGFPLNLVLPPRTPERVGEPSIVAFHGLPHPHQALQGYEGKRPHHFTRPASWIGEHWAD
ncbi:glycosyl transferase [Microbulbifer taiwanensis]|uniref:Glycosyltransferase n=1 Tax=Microbulbifer taiwanensis TaxID=986746 RepID=A0ABW1YPD3_9GAMM|nr:glycosyl transferase [Microbulbifer taiwanensis]